MAKTPPKIMSVRVEPEIFQSLVRCAAAFDLRPLVLASQYIREGVARDLGAEDFLDVEEQAAARLNREHLKELANRKARRPASEVVYDLNHDYSSLQRKGSKGVRGIGAS